LKLYYSLIDKHYGATAIIVGAGPSTYQVLQNKCWNVIENFFDVLVAVNSGIMAFDWSQGQGERKYWLSNDALCRRWSWWEDVKKSKSTKIVRNSWLKYKEELDGFLYFKPRPTSEGIINKNDLGLAYCSSVPSSLDLCLQMGCKKIFLIGVDHSGYINERNIEYKTIHHFWQFFPPDKQPKASPPAQGDFKQQQRVFKTNDLAYKALKKFAAEKNAEVYNCNPNSKMKIFKCISFDDAIKLCKK